MVTRTEYHSETASEFLARARAYLAADDLLQASEKGWGAAARAVKAVAESRGWNHSTHGRLFRVIDLLVDETGRNELDDHFGAANMLHVNFYEGWLSARQVADHLNKVERLVALLRPLAG